MLHRAPDSSCITVAVPTSLEAAPLKRTVPDSERIRWLMTGVGPASAAHRVTSHLFTENRPSLLILAGIAGAYQGAGLEPGQVCLALSECFGDLGRCLEDRMEPIVLPEPDTVPCHFDLFSDTSRAFSALQSIVPWIAAVHMTTVSCSSAGFERAETIRNFTGAAVENMEGAAVAMCCQQMEVPLIELRAISNVAGEADRGKWEIGTALEHLSHALSHLLSLFFNQESLTSKGG